MARRGFTILETMLVLAVMLIIAAIAIPSIDSMYSDVKLTTAADMVRGTWADARARAAEDGVAYRFAVVPQSGRFKVSPDAEEAPADGGDAPLSREDSLPGNITFADGSDTSGDSSDGEYQTLIVFYPDGTTREDVEVGFRGRGSRTFVLRLRGLTGAVTSSWQGGGQ
jgi:prepilin-type N-terminal cleavage/methylation domain-containing protein